LGLPVPTIHIASRITEYAAALDTLPESTITASLKNDRWETASELLSRRDELLLSGWDESESESLPEVVNDLARKVKENGGHPLENSGQADNTSFLDPVGQVIEGCYALPVCSLLCAEKISRNGVN
jgi:hypothetical protein